MLSEEIILNEVRLGGIPTINFALANNMAGGIRIKKMEISFFCKKKKICCFALTNGKFLIKIDCTLSKDDK